MLQTIGSAGRRTFQSLSVSRNELFTGGAEEEALRVLRSTFGYPHFVGKQREVISHVLAGKDALALMPTGGGKSLCYQIPGLIRPGAAVVVSPLISLMKDQVDALLQHGVRAACLNSSLTLKQVRKTEEDFAAGQLDFLYIAPERLLSERGLQTVRSGKVALFAIDEAHCVSQWGHDFRPEYLKLGKLAELFPGVPRLALTATADSHTREEILQKLQLKSAGVFIASFDRANICFSVARRDNPRKQLLEFYRQKHQGHSGIVYCMSRAKTESVQEFLEGEGIRAYPYHAGMKAKERREYQEKFIYEEGVVMAATIAFGMGINKTDVRFVVHMDMPKSVEGYYQEVGRAGRDGLPADALLLFGLNDVITLRRMIDEGTAPEHIRGWERQKLNALAAFCEAAGCRRQSLLRYFGEEYEPPCDNCDNCISPPQVWDGTEAAKKFLSCVARTGERFGAGHVSDVLLGKDNDKIRRFRHDQLSTYGIGEDLPAKEWGSVARQLLAAGLLAPDSEGHGSLCLTPASWEVMRGERTVMLRRESKPKREKKKEERPRSRPSEELNSEQAEVFDKLRAVRRQLAERQNVPAYVIFHDSVLVEIVRRNPKTIEEFAGIPGISDTKLQRYASEFLKALTQEE